MHQIGHCLRLSFPFCFSIRKLTPQFPCMFMIYDFERRKRRLLSVNVKDMDGEFIGTGQSSSHFVIHISFSYRAKG